MPETNVQPEFPPTPNPYDQITAAVRASGIPQGQIAALLGISRVAVNDRMAGRARWQLAEVVTLGGTLSEVHDVLMEARP